MIVICQAGYENLLCLEARAAGLGVRRSGPGWADIDGQSGMDLAFAHLIFGEGKAVAGETVNALAQQISTHFLESIRGERIEGSWPCVFGGPAEMVGLGRRTSAVEKEFLELLKKKLSRVAKLATFDMPREGGEQRGLFVWFNDFKEAVVARSVLCNGPRRMADDDAAPSRSYLKVEEAYRVIGQEPAPGETVADLGAAPGGWSYSAAKRGAKVYAIDNGPLKGGALGHAQIEHRMEDAFRFVPPEGKVDWLFCDMVEEPHHVVRNIVEPWLSRGLCRRFVINLKFGRVDAVALLRELRAPGSPFVAYGEDVKIRHLYHDREEFTVVGRVRTTEQ